MNKLFLRIYLPVALSLLGTVVLTAFLTFRIAPERARDLHTRHLAELRGWIVGHPGATPGEITAAGDSLGLGEVQTVPLPPVREGTQPPMPRPGHVFLPGLPQEMGFLVEVPLLPGGRDIFTRAAIWSFILILLGATAISLFASLAPLRARLNGLQGAVAELGAGNLAARVPGKEDGDILDSLGGTFNSMAGRISDLVGSHQELLGSVAHELRTPIARMRFALEMLKESGGAPDARIEAMERDISSLDSLLAELLSFNRLGRAAQPVKREIQLEDLVREAAEAEGFTAQGRSFECRGSATTHGDPSLIGRAVSNMLRNAFQHARSKVAAELGDADGAVWLEVSDDGPGFEAGLADRLGRPFAKGSSSQGTGLGLATVEKVASLHGGFVAYGASDIGGASVKLSLPRA